MDFDAAIESHELWKEVLSEYVRSGGKYKDVNRLESLLNINDKHSHKVLGMFRLSSVRLDPGFIRNDQNCKLGQWILLIEDLFHNNGDFVKLDELHTKFHRLSAEIIEQVERGNQRAARKLISPESEFYRVANDIVIYITRIQRLVASTRVRST